MYPQQESHPFQIQTVAGNAAVTALTASRFPNTQWLYVTREPLPTSRGKTWEDQQEILDDVCEMAGRKYEPLTVQQACSAAFNLKAATGEDLFPQENTENDVKRTYTRLEGAIGAGHFIVGRMGPTGLQVAIALDTMSLSSIGLHAAVVLGKNGEF